MQLVSDDVLAEVIAQMEADPAFPAGWVRSYAREHRERFLALAEQILQRRLVAPRADTDCGISNAELATYDHFLVAFSGGKDSVACVLYLLDRGVPRGKIELWHHDVDGREGSGLVDWPCTAAYCRAFAAALGLRLFFSWKVRGFEGEMLRAGTPTAPTAFEMPVPGGGVQVVRVGGKGPAGTRLKFPQVSADLSVRWCSAYLKIDVCATAIRNQDRLLGKRVVLLTGERAEESANRARYHVFEPDRTDNRDGLRARRHVDHWRPVHGWPEKQVWAIIEQHRINPHPAYRLGFGRVSCARCIFSDADQWASSYAVDPAAVDAMAQHEQRFGVTIHRKLTVLQQVARGRAYPMNAVDLAAARSREFVEPILLAPGTWRLPRGAFGDTTGPT